MHRENDRPAVILYDKDGEIEYEIWYLNGEKHRENDRPAEIFYDKDGEIEVEIWRLNDQLHRENDRPAEIAYYENGEIEDEVWYLNGQLHRENDLPAVIDYDEDGEIEYEAWWLNGEFIKSELSSTASQQSGDDNTSTEDDVDVLNDYLASGASNSEKYQAFADFVESRPYAYDPTACSAEINKSYLATAEGFKDVVDSTQPPAELLPFFDDLIAWLEKYDGLIQEYREGTDSTEIDESEQKLAVIMLQHQIITRGHSEALNDGSGDSIETANSHCKYDIPGLRI